MKRVIGIFCLLSFITFITSCGNETISNEKSTAQVEKKEARKKRNKKPKAKGTKKINKPADVTVASSESRVMAPDTYPLYPGCIRQL